MEYRRVIFAVLRSSHSRPVLCYHGKVYTLYSYDPELDSGL
jgi:hypothetical protein